MQLHIRREQCFRIAVAIFDRNVLPNGIHERNICASITEQVDGVLFWCPCWFRTHSILIIAFTRRILCVLACLYVVYYRSHLMMCVHGYRVRLSWSNSQKSVSASIYNIVVRGVAVDCSLVWRFDVVSFFVRDAVGCEFIFMECALESTRTHVRKHTHTFTHKHKLTPAG